MGDEQITKPTSSMTQQIWYIDLVIESAEPDNVTARSVEFGNISLATCMLAPVLYKRWSGK